MVLGIVIYLHPIIRKSESELPLVFLNYFKIFFFIFLDRSKMKMERPPTQLCNPFPPAAVLVPCINHGLYRHHLKGVGSRQWSTSSSLLISNLRALCRNQSRPYLLQRLIITLSETTQPCTYLRWPWTEGQSRTRHCLGTATASQDHKNWYTSIQDDPADFQLRKVRHQHVTLHVYR